MKYANTLSNSSPDKTERQTTPPRSSQTPAAIHSPFTVMAEEAFATLAPGKKRGITCTVGDYLAENGSSDPVLDQWFSPLENPPKRIRTIKDRIPSSDTDDDLDSVEDENHPPSIATQFPAGLKRIPPSDSEDDSEGESIIVSDEEKENKDPNGNPPTSHPLTPPRPPLTEIPLETLFNPPRQPDSAPPTPPESPPA